ncbi:nuclear condensing complex subunit [Dichomitus squalens]|nr:nuclear condensing complex subunit [Dichomitus squalens]
MPARNAAPFDLESLNAALPKIFDQVQNTSANHQKNYVALYKLHREAEQVKSSVQNDRSTKLVGEKAFWDVFDDMMLRVLPVKKGVGQADRTVKFMGGYTKFAMEKNFEYRKERELDEDEDTFADRFITHAVRFFLEGCTAKDKVVRMRVLQCIAETITNLGAIDEDLYAELRAALLDRLRDKEPSVRSYAVLALSKLAISEETAELDEDEPTILDMLIETMTYDPAAEVRRAAVTHLPATPYTLPALLARTRDVDAATRRLVYVNVLEKYCTGVGEDSRTRVGFTHPRVLTIAQREQIVRNGLGDREDIVKKAAAQLLGVWVDVVRTEAGKEVKPEENVKRENGEEVIEDLVAFLNLFDLEEGKVAEDALGSVFDTRVDIFEHIEFSDDYWTNLTPERAFLARVFVDKCISKEAHARVEATLPVTTAMAFRIQDAYNALAEQMKEESAYDEDDDEEARAAREEARLDRELTIAELLRLALNLDYKDEIGRRKMSLLVRGMIAQDFLSESLLARPLDVLRVISESEQDLIRVVVEVVHELRDPPTEEESEVKADMSVDPDDSMTEAGGSPKKPKLPKPVAEMTPEEKARMDVVDLRCLSLCIGMLERVNGTFEDNPVLQGILGELVIPAVKRREMALREKGLTCLGLCCLIARHMAASSFQLFLNQVAAAPEVLKLRVLQIIFDILMVHESVFLAPGSENEGRIVMFLLAMLGSDQTDKVHALVCAGTAKLMLAGLLADEQVLLALVLAYMSPETVGNHELRQCLSYFFPVYSYSSAENQRRMQRTFIPMFEWLTKAYHTWDGEEDMVAPSQAALMFADWTDPIQAAYAVKGLRKDAHKDPIHLDLAHDILKALFSIKYSKEDKKALYQVLGKLYLPDEVDADKVRILKLLVDNLRTRRPPRDTAGKNALIKFDSALAKRYEKQLENFSEDEFRKLEELKDLFEFLDDIVPLEEDEDEPPKKGRKRRSMSVATETTSVMSDDRSPPPSPRKKSKAKRRRLSQSDDESDDDALTETSRASPSATPAPTRLMPKRNAGEKGRNATKKAIQETIVISSDDEDEDEEDDDGEGDEDDENNATPVAKAKANGARR